MRIVLIGNQHSGKSSLFQALTQEKPQPEQAVEAPIIFNHDYHLIDLPGFYSLSNGPQAGLSMEYAAQVLVQNPPDLIINVVNASLLERELFLSTQLMELGCPMVMVLTHVDKLHEKQISLKIDMLEKQLGLKIIVLHDYDAISTQALFRDHIETFSSFKPNIIPWPEALKPSPDLSIKKQFALRRLLESQSFHQGTLHPSDDLYQAALGEEQVLNDKSLDALLLLLDTRYQFVHQALQKSVVKVSGQGQAFSHKLDKLLLHRFWGWPIFLMVLLAFFSLAVDVGGTFQQELSASSDWFFQFPVQKMMGYLHAPIWLKWIVVDGLGQGVSTMLSFLPVMAFMNIFLSMLESSGYMARIAFLFERIMRRIGLPGKAFLPLLIGFGCNVPAIMAARTVNAGRERLLTVLLSPFMSCSARLTIYAVFASLFFPRFGGLVVLSLYILGIIMAILTGLLLRRYWLTGKVAPVALELPIYRLPSMKRLFKDVYLRLKLFLIRSGKLVVPFCVVLGTFQAAMAHGFVFSESLKTSASMLWIYVFHPLLAPIGISLENWPAAVGLLTGSMAKEIVIATLNTLYSQMPELLGAGKPFLILKSFMVLPEMVKEQIDFDASRRLMGAFGGPIAAYSYLLFVLLYIPCISTLAIIRQEVGRFWQWFALLWSLWIAYSVSSLFYQVATIKAHPIKSLLWVLGVGIAWVLIVLLFKHWKPKHVKSHSSLH
jgi:ferrous iron transport protein B